MKNIPVHLRLLFQILLITLAGLFLSRLFFYINNIHTFDSLSPGEVIAAFLFGIRFDMWSFSMAFLPVILLIIFPYPVFHFRFSQRFIKWYFIIVLPLILIPDFADSEYSKFTGKRSTSDLFSLITTGDDTMRMIPDFLRDFWHVALGWVIVSSLLIWLFLRIYRKLPGAVQVMKKGYLRSVITFIVIGGLWILCIRGTGLKPASLNTALVYTRPAGVILVLNSSFTIINTVDKETLVERKYMSAEDAPDYFNPVLSYKSNEIKTDNVVIIIFESLGAEYCGYINGSGFTPFLDSLFKEGLAVQFNFANGKKSPEALPSIFAGIPTLFDQPYTSSQYVNNKILTLPGLLKRYKYHTAFFHGGKNGTMGFDFFTKVAGFDEYYGLNEYPDKSHFDGNWGIWDHHYLSYFCKTLSGFTQPFMASVFTLSSHHPYQVPPQYEYLPSGDYEIHQPIAYTDEALRQFFNEASKTDWYRNTLFIITGDHTSLTNMPNYISRTGSYMVPLCFYHPSDTTLKGRLYTVTQHCDIFPTVVDYLGFPDTMVVFGKSLLQRRKSIVINYLTGIYWLCDGEYCLLFDGDNSIGLYKFPEDMLEKENLLLLRPEKVMEMEMVTKSVIQQYNNRIRNNRMLP
jgi:phosphoglycerol transferase MdoB-like AlkP superfamily enzyme